MNNHLRSYNHILDLTIFFFLLHYYFPVNNIYKLLISLFLAEELLGSVMIVVED